MKLIKRRTTARIEGDFVVFLIGARINKWWRVPEHFWFMTSMPKMLEELAARPVAGFLGYETLGPTVNVQYWRSVEELTAYARDPDATHYPYWVKFNKRIGSRGDMGIWHETYLVKAGQYECVYNGMPLFGLAKASQSADATGTLASALGRLGKSDGSDAPISPEGDMG